MRRIRHVCLGPLAYHGPMDLFTSNWPAVLIVLALLLILTGLLRRLIKLAIFGVLLGVLGLVIWPLVAG